MHDFSWHLRFGLPSGPFTCGTSVRHLQIIERQRTSHTRHLFQDERHRSTIFAVSNVVEWSISDRGPGLLLEIVGGREGFGSLQSHVIGVRSIAARFQDDVPAAGSMVRK